MKKILLWMIVICLLVSVAGCSRKEDTRTSGKETRLKEERNGFGENTNTREDFAGCEFQIPSYFEPERGMSTSRNRFYYAEYDVSLAMLYLSYTNKSWTEEEYLDVEDDIEEAFVAGIEGAEVVSSRSVMIAGRQGRNIIADGIVQETKVRINHYFFYDEGIGKLVMISLYQSDNTDYSYWADYQKIINAIRVPNTPIVSEDETQKDETQVDETQVDETEEEAQEAETEESEDHAPAGEVNSEFRATMDSYEAFIDDYIAFSEKYKDSDDAPGMMGESMMFVMEYAQIMNEMNSIDTKSLSEADYAYYVEVMGRISSKLMNAGL